MYSSIPIYFIIILLFNHLIAIFIFIIIYQIKIVSIFIIIDLIISMLYSIFILFCIYKIIANIIYSSMISSPEIYPIIITQIMILIEIFYCQKIQIIYYYYYCDDDYYCDCYYRQDYLNCDCYYYEHYQYQNYYEDY